MSEGDPNIDIEANKKIDEIEAFFVYDTWRNLDSATVRRVRRVLTDVANTATDYMFVRNDQAHGGMKGNK